MRTQLIGMISLVRKETSRVLRIWVQTLIPPGITMSLYFIIFGLNMLKRITIYFKSLIFNSKKTLKTYLFLELINSYPNHYRVPLAHKKLGDIYLKSNDVQNAKDKYNFVVREYPNNTASSLALQLLKNME